MRVTAVRVRCASACAILTLVSCVLPQGMDGGGGVVAAGVVPGNGEDLLTLEAEITELQRENARVESQMIRLKSDITAMESHLSHGEKVIPTIHLSHNTIDYLQVLFNNPQNLQIYVRLSRLSIHKTNAILMHVAK